MDDELPYESPIELLDSGKYRVTLSEEERALLARLPEELIPQIEEDADRSTFRLFPPAYSENLSEQVEYDRLMRGDLQASHIASLRLLQSTANETELDNDQLGTWVKALNQIRLVLGARLDVTEDTDASEFEDDDEPRSGAWALYTYLGYLQTEAIDALSEGLPEPTDELEMPGDPGFGGLPDDFLDFPDQP